MEKYFKYQLEPITIEIRDYIEDLGKTLIKKTERTCNRFLAKYGGLSLYGIEFEKRYSIDDENIYY